MCRAHGHYADTYEAILGDGVGEPFGDLTFRLPPGPRAPDLGLPAKFMACMFFAISSSAVGSFAAKQGFSNRHPYYPSHSFIHTWLSFGSVQRVLKFLRILKLSGNLLFALWTDGNLV
jgi:hypothetical protein